MESNPVVIEVEKKALTVIDRASGIVITNNVELEAADKFCVGLHALRKEIVEHHRDLKSKADAAHKAAVAAEKRSLSPVDEAYRITKAKIGEFQENQEKLRREAEEKLRLEAKKQAEDQAVSAAAKAEADGDNETAELIISAPVQATPVVLPRATPKVSTIFTMRHTFVIENPDLVPDEYWMLDETKIGRVVRASDGTVVIPGVIVTSKKS